ncbi:hypothetical protein B0H63DRAFT_511614 [Podospora didyma]|uniref:Leucine-rich repeat-containing protein n=1 Tax=Podospora didyma TaxID=330526 RepID=A0AAE0NI27_9PEZI|nr:hypothetical protein B0H63DRAFT_511614 [Podospora didyma]
MDDSRPSNPKPTGIPRLSKLPVQSSKLPLPRTASLRASPSRDSLATSTSNTSAVGGAASLRNPKLRPAPSRDQLAPTNRPQPSLASSRAVSSPQARSSSAQQATTKYSPNVTKAPRTGRIGIIGGGGGGAVPTSQASSSRPSSVTRPPVPRRQPSQQWISASTTTDSADDEPAVELAEEGEAAEWLPKLNDDEGAGYGTLRPSSFKPRLSLAERTVETLSQLPSSPSVRGRDGAASFYESAGPDRQKSPSRPGSRASRPGSSHHSDGSGRPPSRPSSRPGSSSGHEEGISNFRSSISAYKNTLATIESTPLRGRRSMQALQTPLAKTTPAKSVRSSFYGQPSPIAAPSIPRSRTPSPEKRGPGVSVSRFGARTLAARPTKRPSINGLFRKPSMQGLDKTSPVETPRKVSSASQRSSATSREGTNPSVMSIRSTSTAITTDSAEPASVQASRKSSAALREQIAKAKAARRAAASQQIPSSSPVLEAEQTPLIPTDTTFDFGLSNDPFGQRRDDHSQSKVLQGRLETARTSGRLNIAAMGLREIPAEVMNMYNLESVGRPGGAWAESVDLTRFVAADNELEMINDSVFPDVDVQDFADDEDGQGNIFAGLETLDLHGNMLIALPMGLRRLPLLTSLNLASNRLSNNCLEVISLIPTLRDLKLGGNLLYGPLDPCFSNLGNLEILDLHGNNISSLPSNFSNLSRLRVLNISENEFETLPFETFSILPLTELTARKNQLRGTLIQDSVTTLSTLRVLDVSANQLSQFCSPADGKTIAMPALNQLCLSVNRFQSLPDVSGWTSLVTLSADENSINAIPEGFTGLGQLRTVDFSSNDIRAIPAEVGRMENLTMLRLSGNPLREKKFSSIGTDELKAILVQRLEPPPEHLEPINEPMLNTQSAAGVDVTTNRTPVKLATNGGADANEDNDDSRSDMDDFATPPTSAPGSPARSRSHTLSGQVWPVKSGGVLDRSNTQSSSLHPVVSSKVAACNRIYEIQLHHNLFTAFPESLTFFGETMTSLSLAHNQLVGETYLGGLTGNEGLDLPSLKELNLSSNHITGLGPLVAHLRAPNLQRLDISINRISSLPPGAQLRDAFPNLTVLLMANNHLADLEPESIKGMRIVDVSNNDIAHLNPRLGLLGGNGGLEKLDVSGNRFRVPRWNVLERGTEATLRWLRSRVPVAEMGAWNGDNGEHETSLADLD